MESLFATLSINNTQHNNTLIEYHYRECCISFIVMLSVVMLSVITLKVVTLSVVAPLIGLCYKPFYFSDWFGIVIS
jgi:hypothetical protein